MNNAITVTDENLNDIISSAEISLITFSAPWCGPCRMLGPIIDELHNENEGVTIGKLNVDENSAVSSKYGIRGIPTMILFKGGKEVDKIVGATSKASIQAKINALKS